MVKNLIFVKKLKNFFLSSYPSKKISKNLPKTPQKPPEIPQNTQFYIYNPGPTIAGRFFSIMSCASCPVARSKSVLFIPLLLAPLAHMNKQREQHLEQLRDTNRSLDQRLQSFPRQITTTGDLGSIIYTGISS